MRHSVWMGLAAAALALGGCSHSFEWRNAEDYRALAFDTSREGLLVALSCDSEEADTQELCFEIAKSLSERGGYRVRYPADARMSANVRVRVSVTDDRYGSFGNILVAFPGYFIFTPGWLGYGYTIERNVTCTISAGNGKPMGELTLPITLNVRHADAGRTWATSTIWPLAPLSLLNGLYCVTYDSDVDAQVVENIYPTLGAYIAGKIIAEVNGASAPTRYTAPVVKPIPAPTPAPVAKPAPAEQSAPEAKPVVPATDKPAPAAKPVAKPAPIAPVAAKPAAPAPSPTPAEESPEARRLKEMLEFGLIDRPTYEAQLRALSK